MGQGAVRSQMDLRICFRVREPRDVDLILGQGMLRAGWDAHNLNAPGKFLISAPGHDQPKRHAPTLLSDDTVAATAAHYACNRPRVDHASRRAADSARRPHAPSGDNGPAPANPQTTHEAPETTSDALWLALRAAPEHGSARASARNARTRTTGRTDGTSTHRGIPAREPLSDQERATIRQAGPEDARRSRIANGLPERIEDSEAVAALAAILRRAPNESTSHERNPAL
jgi:hypothetical protein